MMGMSVLTVDPGLGLTRQGVGLAGGSMLTETMDAATEQADDRVDQQRLAEQLVVQAEEQGENLVGPDWL